MPDDLTPAAAVHAAAGTADAPAAVRERAGRCELRVGVPAADGASLARSVAEALTGERTPLGSWTRRGGVRELTAPGVTARLTGGWDGPVLTLTRPGGATGPELDGSLLTRIAGPSGPSGRAPDEGLGEADRDGTAAASSLPVPDGRRTTWYRAWRELAELCGLPPRTCAEVVAPGVLRTTCGRDPVLVHDHVGPPPMPPGWLLHSWSAHQAGLHHFSLRPGQDGPVPHVYSARPEERDRAAALRRAWAALAARPPGDRPLPPGTPSPVLPSFGDLGPL
ncbi:hypothetical protein [Streptomyces sp. NPDC056600]|uniref:hypothetical protein n=1 Tax=Streptomyces sp. NPDC056600 TaxID=3345874 RepID=UPI0036CEBE41